MPFTPVLDHPQLRAHLLFSVLWLHLPVCTVRREHPGLDIVRQVHFEYVLDDGAPQFLVPHREQDLDAFLEVAGHHVRGPEQDLLFAPVPEIVYPGMLQETSQDGGDPDVVADALDARPEAALARAR